MKKQQLSTYTAPVVEVMQMEVESGIATSPSVIYVDAGGAFDEIMYDDEL